MTNAMLAVVPVMVAVTVVMEELLKVISLPL
jgi:hypothetical protein